MKWSRRYMSNSARARNNFFLRVLKRFQNGKTSERYVKNNVVIVNIALINFA